MLTFPTFEHAALYYGCSGLAERKLVAGEDKIEAESEDIMIKKGTTLEPAKRYKVTHREDSGKTVTATRIFKWTETRFGGDVFCFVFTSRVDKSVVAEFSDNKLRMSGRRLPKQEISIPIYDLISID